MIKKLLIGTFVSLLISTNLFGVKITALKTSIAEESFQLGIVTEVLKKMGYDVEVSNDVSYDIAYQTIANNAKSDDVYFFASGWNPLHDGKLKALGENKFARFTPYISNCAQGYLIDKKTAEKYNIKYINDLKDPKIAKLFDISGNGKADLAGCAPGWGCEKVIEYQLDAFGLRDTITHNQGEYAAIVTNSIARYKTGKPILYYTWTPYWVSGKLVPGKDVVFLQVTHSANPNQASTKLSNGADYGFAVNSQDIVANASVKTKHKDIAKLFKIMNVNVNDVSGENMLMTNGQNKEKDIKKHVKLWMEKNKATVDSWIKKAKAAK
jgi:glycine betaine/proline transport system substrate-binding protein